MALSTSIAVAGRPDNWGYFCYPSQAQYDWLTLVDAPDVAETGDAVVGGKVVRPGSIVRAEQRLFLPQNRVSKLLIALKYAAALTISQEPVVRVFGRDSRGQWHLLRDGSGAVELTLAADTADVVDDAGAFKSTEPVEVDIEGSYAVLVAVQTELTGSGAAVNTSEIMVKGKTNG